MTDGKAHCAINSKFLKQPDQLNQPFYEIELAKAQVGRKDLVVVKILKLQNAKLRMLRIYYNFFDKFCDLDHFEELEMDTDYLYHGLAERKLTNCTRTEMKAEWELLQFRDCDDSFTTDASGNFARNTKSRRENGVPSKKNLG